MKSGLDAKPLFLQVDMLSLLNFLYRIHILSISCIYKLFGLSLSLFTIAVM